MFPTQTYIDRRERLKQEVASGLLLFLGNDESPMNYPDNHYRFRQDSSFLYFWGVNLPGLAAIVDIDEDREILFGRNLTIEDIVVTGPRPALKEMGLKGGVHEVADFDQLEAVVKPAIAKGRKIHFLPQYRAENFLIIQQLLEMDAAVANASVSTSFIKAVVAQRSIKTREEIEQIETALSVTYDMQALAMKLSKPGIYEREPAGAMAGLAYSRGGAGLAYPIIFTVNGHILHNFHHDNKMKEGDIVINDSGAESAMHYASDITRTFPVDGRFNQQQREIYSIVLNAQEKAIQASRPGVEYRNIHILTCKHITAGLIALGLMKGDVDSAVGAGAHALFMPHGLGHMLGLDVHDMEGLGEDYVGYTDEIQRSEQFGIRQLRLARALEPGFVITAEPGLYFIPALIDQWKAEKRFEEFIDYIKVESYINFGGVRIEDNVLILEDGRRVLGKPIPKSIEDVEAYSSQFF
jgi:Xaa-Pro aminopeptidase